MTITPVQNKALHMLLSSSGMAPYKKELVYSYSGGRTDSSRELTTEEAADLINHLKSMHPEQMAMEKMRRKIIHMAREMGWNKDDKADMVRIDEWCQHYGHGHKALNHYTYQELPKLVSQMELTYRHYLSKL